MTPDTRNKAIASAVFAVLLAGIVYYNFFAGNSATTAAPSVAAPATVAETPAVAPAAASTGSGHPARRVGEGSAALDPALHMQGMLASEAVEYSGAGRNIFSQNSAPAIVIPKPVAPPRPVARVAPVIPLGPPPPPPIDLTFFGTETDSTGVRQAILLHQDAVYTAKAGDVVLRRYRILSIEARTLQVEDMVTSNRQTLALVAD